MNRLLILTTVALVATACATSTTEDSADVTSSPAVDVEPETSAEVSADLLGADSDAPGDGAPLADVLLDAGSDAVVWPDIDTSLEPEAVALVDNGLWSKTLSAEDPWWTPDAGEELCEPMDYGPENTPLGELFDVDTSFCGYVTVGQTLLEEVPIGERFVVTVVQYPLSDSEGPYLVALAIGDPAVTVWETTLEVPAEFQVVEASWGAARTYAAGEPVYFHISNHGENTWSFVSLVHQADD